MDVENVINVVEKYRGVAEQGKEEFEKRFMFASDEDLKDMAIWKIYLSAGGVLEEISSEIVEEEIEKFKKMRDVCRKKWVDLQHASIPKTT